MKTIYFSIRMLILFFSLIIPYHLSAQLCGVYTINPTIVTGGTNFQNFNDAINALSLNGISCAVTFNVAPATYNENIYLGAIVGSSASNTITFNGTNALTTILSYDGSSSNATWQMVGTSDVIIKNLTIETTKTSSDAWGIHLSNDVFGLTIDSCRFITPVTTTTDIIGLVASSSTTSESTGGNNVNELTITNSYFIGGESGVHLEGPSTGFLSNINISNNEFYNHDDQAIEMDQVENVIINNNYIVYNGSNTSSDGIFIFDINDYQINANIINVPDYGVYINDGNDGYSTTVRSTLINNIIISTNRTAMELYDFENTNIYHNTLKGNQYAIEITSHTAMDVRNNIFDGGNSISFFINQGLTTADTVDYNLYYSSGNLVKIIATNYSDLISWQTANSNYNLNSIEATPSFVSNVDLHMNMDYTVYNNGIDVGVTVDVDGDARPQGPNVEIGADEFVIAATNDIGVSSLIYPSSLIECENDSTYFDFIVSNYGNSSESSVPFVFEILTNNNVNIVDTSFITIAPSSSDTITIGPINTNGFGASSVIITTNLTGDIDSSNDTLVTSILFDAVELILPSDTTVCGEEITIMPLSSFNSYLWNDGSVNSLYTATSSEAVSLEVENDNGCVARDTMQISLIEYPIVNLGNDTSFCSNEAFELDLTSGIATSYNWSNSSSQQTITITTEGVYYVRATNQGICVSSDTIVIVKNEIPEVDAGNDTVWCEGTAFNLPTNSSTGVPLVWTDEFSNIVNTVAAEGIYFVEGIENGCSVIDSLMVLTCNATGIRNSKSTINVEVYPNPATDFLTINFAETLLVKKMEIVSVTGQILFRNSSLEKESIIIDLKAFNKGIYFLNLYTESNIFSYQFRKK